MCYTEGSEVKEKGLLIENLISFNELVDRGLFKKGTLYYLTSNKIIPFVKVGRKIFFEKPVLERWLEKRRVNGV